MAIKAINAPPSTNIQSVAYDADTQTLFVRFRWQDALYQYRNVSEDDALGFERSLSATDYLKSLSLTFGERIA